MGVHIPNGLRVVDLPGPLTLALMTYARDLGALSAAALEAGHELLLHVPMEPTDRDWDTGPNALMLGLDSDELARRLAWNFSRFEGYVGVNNHMGSRFTEDKAAMAHLRRRPWRPAATPGSPTSGGTCSWTTTRTRNRCGRGSPSWGRRGERAPSP